MGHFVFSVSVSVPHLPPPFPSLLFTLFLNPISSLLLCQCLCLCVFPSFYPRLFLSPSRQISVPLYHNVSLLLFPNLPLSPTSITLSHSLLQLINILISPSKMEVALGAPCLFVCNVQSSIRSSGDRVQGEDTRSITISDKNNWNPGGLW